MKLVSTSPQAISHEICARSRFQRPLHNCNNIFKTMIGLVWPSYYLIQHGVWNNTKNLLLSSNYNITINTSVGSQQPHHCATKYQKWSELSRRICENAQDASYVYTNSSTYIYIYVCECDYKASKKAYQILKTLAIRSQDLSYPGQQWPPFYKQYCCTQPMDSVLQRPSQLPAEDRCSSPSNWTCRLTSTTGGGL